MTQDQIPNETDKAYAAGLLDADGSICLVDCKSYVQVNVYIASQDLDLIRWLVETFGGRHQVMGRVHAWWPPAPSHEWLRLVRPYLHTKKSQADLVFEYKAATYKGISSEWGQRSKELNGRLPRLHPKKEGVQAEEDPRGNTT